MIKHIVFDYDDTLTLTQKAGFKLENLIASELGFEPMSEEIHKNTWGHPLPEIIGVRFPGINVEQFMSKVGGKMKELTEKGEFDVITPEVQFMLTSLTKNNINVFVLTSRTQTESLHLIEDSFPLMKYIPKNNFYFRERTNFKKPDPRVFETLVAENSLLPREVLYVGDSPTDAIAAKLAGMYFIASLESGLKHKDDFPKGYVDRYIKSLTELPRLIENQSNLKFKIPKEIASVVETHKLSVPHDYFVKNIPELNK